MKIIEPSLLALDKNKAKEQLQAVKELGLKCVHYDVMDTKFIGHTSFITEHLEYLKTLNIAVNVHLMVQEPMKWIKLYKPYLVNAITFHCETQSLAESRKILDYIHSLGFKAGLAVKMETDLDLYRDLASCCDIITIMSVEPGLGGQKYSDKCLHNLKVCKEWKKIKPDLRVQTDGGINDIYVKQLWDYVDNFITGSWFFKNLDKMPSFIKEFNDKQKN